MWGGVSDGRKSRQGDMKRGMRTLREEWHILNVVERSNERKDCIHKVKSQFG